MIGETVGNYRIIRLIGEGGMGVVYLAEHPGIGRKAAVKVLHPRLAENEEVVARFFNEARAANTVRHPGIVEVFDFGTLASGATYIIMEFLEGESLAARLRRAGRMAIGDAVDLACRTAEVLSAAHEQGIVHRDLKPDNLFLIPDAHAPGRVALKVLDFGIAKLGVATAGAGSVKTRTGLIMGTPVYMSPEQCRGTKEVDLRTDIYALGIILYEMVCGQPPFVSEGQGELIHMHIGTPPPPPRMHNAGVPQELEDVILKTLAKEPSGRFQTMEDLWHGLKGVPAGAVAATQIYPVKTSILPPGTVPIQTTFSTAASMIENAPIERRRSKWLVPLSLSSAAAIVAGAWWLTVKPVHLAPLPARPAEDMTATADQVLPTAPDRKAPAESPKVISVGITSDPAGARVVRENDGADIGVTPFRESWPARVGVEKLRIELEGFTPEPFVVPLDRGVDLAFGLKKIPASPPHRNRSHSRRLAPSLAPSGTARPSAPEVVPHRPKAVPSSEPVPL